MRYFLAFILAISVVSTFSISQAADAVPSPSPTLTYPQDAPTPSPSPIPSVQPSPSPSITISPVSAPMVNAIPTDIDMRPYLGVFGGMDFASVEHNDPGTGHRKGFQIGADLELPIFVWLWFQPEIKYVQEGYSISSSPLGTPVNATVPFNYLAIPLHAKIKLAQGMVAPFAIFGPTVAAKLSGGNQDIGDGESSGTNLRSWDVSLDIGLGTDIQITNNSKLFVSFEYSAGLVTIVPDTQDGNRNIQLIAGWNFAI